jgi:hypothetical protein
MIACLENREPHLGRLDNETMAVRMGDFSPAESSPLSPPFHPHSVMSDIVSLGASSVFWFQPERPPVTGVLSANA